MNLKNLIALFLTGLFLMNLTVSQSGGLLKVLTGKEVTVVHPFCKKSKSTSNKGNALTADPTSTSSIEIPAICTTAFDFKTASFSFVTAENNFKAYGFTDILHLKLFTEQLYIPPRA